MNGQRSEVKWKGTIGREMNECVERGRVKEGKSKGKGRPCLSEF